VSFVRCERDGSSSLHDRLPAAEEANFAAPALTARGFERKAADRSSCRERFAASRRRTSFPPSGNAIGSSNSRPQPEARGCKVRETARKPLGRQPSQVSIACFVLLPSLSLPLVVCCFGTNAIQPARLRPDRTLSGRIVAWRSNLDGGILGSAQVTGERRRIMIGRTLLIGIALVAGSLATGGPAHAKCQAFVVARALITVAPDTGQIAPDALVGEGRQVVLYGVADRVHGKIDCSISTEPINFRWSLTYHPRGGLPVDATAQLSPHSALTVRFVAQNGTYVAQLETVGLPFEYRVATVRIEAVRHDGWVSIGPDGRYTYNTNGSLSAGAGRINALAIHPNSPNIMYAGSGRGGVWRSDNGGAEWWPMTDHKGLPAGLSIGRLAVAPSGRVYASAPDIEGGTAYFANGGWLYWSDDEGVTWNKVVADPFCASSTPPGAPISRLIVDPTAPSTVFAATSAPLPGSGVFRSTDGGRCWDVILSNQQVFDMVLQQQTPGQTTLYVATSGATTIGASVLVTSNANAAASSVQWQQTSAPASTPPFAAPLTRIALASSLNVVYALVAQGPTGAKTGQLRLFQSSGGGAWLERAEPLVGGNDNYCASQCSYNLSIAVNPQRPNDIVVGTVTVMRSTDGGATWSELNPGPGSSLWDHHALVYHPTDATLLYSANDAGVQTIRFSSLGAPLGNWSYLNAGFSNGMFEGLAISQNAAAPERSVGGLQDAGTRLRQFGRMWTLIGGGDGKWAAIDAGNPSIVYYTSSLANTGNAFVRYIGSPLPPTIGTAPAFWADPVLPGVLLAWNPVAASRAPFGIPYVPLTGLYLSSNVATAATGADVTWACVDPTPSNPTNFSGAIAFPPGVDLYLVGTKAGTIYRVTKPTIVGSTPVGSTPCSSNTSTAKVAELWTAPLINGNSTSVIGIAPDSAKPTSSFFATLFRYDAFRVASVKRQLIPDVNSGVRPAWIGTPIAGAPGTPGAFPISNDSCCPGTFGPFGFTDPIASDPDDPKTLYVGTISGVVIGKQQPDESWKWSFDPDIPETWVTSIQTYPATSSHAGAVRAAAYGRGVFERVRILDIATLAGSKIAFTDTSAAERMDSVQFRSERSVAVSYAYDGRQGEQVTLRLRPRGESRVDQFFLSTSARSYHKGNGVRDLEYLPLGGRGSVGGDNQRIQGRNGRRRGARDREAREGTTVAMEAMGHACTDLRCGNRPGGATHTLWSGRQCGNRRGTLAVTHARLARRARSGEGDDQCPRNDRNSRRAGRVCRVARDDRLRETRALVQFD